jgi:hypothetical protein
LVDIKILEKMAISTLNGGGEIRLGGIYQDPYKEHLYFLFGPGKTQIHPSLLVETKISLLKLEKTGY